jgi:hypothetical protein
VKPEPTYPTPTPEPSESPSPHPSRLPSPAPAISQVPVIKCTDPYPKELPETLFKIGFQRFEHCFHPDSLTDPADGPVGLPKPCRPMAHASDALILDRRGMDVFVDDGAEIQGQPVVHSHTVTKYRPGGAQSYLTELREALDRCGPYTRGSVTYDYKTLTGFGTGPDRVAIRLEWVDPQADETRAREGSALILAERAGDHVVVIHDRGWEVFASRDATISRALTSGVAAVRALG